jgi:hypothetical protein
MKKLLVVLISVTLLASFAMAGWQHAETIFDFSAEDSVVVGAEDEFTGDFNFMNSPHGVVVDPDGKIWVTLHNGMTEGFLCPDPGDVDGDGVTEEDTSYYKPVFVFEKDGDEWVEADFGHIKQFELPGGGSDTLHTLSPHNGSGKGITLDRDGNVLVSSWSTVYKFNYQTGECMARYIPESLGSITEASQDHNSGLYYHSWVLGGSMPVVVLDEDLEKVTNAIDTLGYITRSIAVKSDESGATDFYMGTTWNGWGVPQYHSDAPPTDPIAFDGFELVDTLGRWTYHGDDTSYVDPLWSSSLDFNPDKSKLLVGCLWHGPGWAGPHGSRWYLIDLETREADTIGVPVSAENYEMDDIAGVPDFYLKGGAAGPRGGFFVDDETLYTVDFYLWTLDKWTYSEVGVENNNKLVNTFELKQNYPNPFNPTTTIPFTLDKKAKVTLKVYNMLGQEVATVVDNELRSAGYNTAMFDASELAAGMYLYRINANGKHMTKKMMLIK